MLRRDGDNDCVERLAIDAGVAKAADAVAEAQRCAVCRQPAAGRFRQQFTEGNTRQQQIGVGTARTAQAVAQHIGEQLRRSAFHRRVQCGEAERFPQLLAQDAGLAGGIEPVGDALVVRQAKAAPFDALHPQRGFQLFRQVDRSSAKQPPGDIERCRQLRQGQPETTGTNDLQRPALEQQFRIGADLAHQRQRFAIGAEQDVLAVVERASVDFHRTRPATWYTAGFKQRHCSTAPGQFDGRSQPGPAGADDRDAYHLSP